MDKKALTLLFGEAMQALNPHYGPGRQAPRRRGAGTVACQDFGTSMVQRRQT